MFLVAALVLVIAELYVIIQVGHAIGALDTIGLLILGTLIGVWLVKREGLGVMRRIDAHLRRNEPPGKELVDGFLILVAGILITVPGFISDGLGFLLLVPPVRAGIRGLARRRFERRMGVGWLGDRGRFAGRRRIWVESRVVDVERSGDRDPADGAVPDDRPGPSELPPGRY